MDTKNACCLPRRTHSPPAHHTTPFWSDNLIPLQMQWEGTSPPVRYEQLLISGIRLLSCLNFLYLRKKGVEDAGKGFDALYDCLWVAGGLHSW